MNVSARPQCGFNNRVLLRVAHLAHDSDEGLVASVRKGDVQHGLELLVHGGAWIGTKAHLQWLVDWFAPIATAAVGDGCVVRAIDSQRDDHDENCNDCTESVIQSNYGM